MTHGGFETPFFYPIITSVQTNNMSLSPEFIRTSLQGLYGESVAAADIRAWCAMNGANYQTVTNKLLITKLVVESGT